MCKNGKYYYNYNYPIKINITSLLTYFSYNNIKYNAHHLNPCSAFCIYFVRNYYHYITFIHNISTILIVSRKFKANYLDRIETLAMINHPMSYTKRLD